MARKTITMAALAAMVVTVMAPATAMAQDRYYGSGYSGYDQRHDYWQRRDGDRRDWHDDRGYDRRQDAYTGRDDRGAPVRYGYRGDRGGYDRGYYDQGGYGPAYRAPASYGYRCQGSGTTGAIIGAVAGGVLGNGLAGRGDRTLGLLLGGGAGALAGRAIDRSHSHC